MPEILALIPARGGSKGIPRKNIAPLGGRPLLAYTCEAALRSARVTRTIVDTDDADIAAAARECGAEVPYLRPRELAADDTPALPVIQHALQRLDSAEQYRPDVVVLLQPSSPLRDARQVDAALELLERTGADSVVSVVEVPHQYNPTSVLRLEGERLRRFLDGPAPLRRQEKPRVYARNGPAVLAVRAEVLHGGSLYGDDVRPLLMDRISSADVDEPLDLAWVEFLLSTGQVVAHD